MRESGILLHISSLPSKYGIGTLGKEAYKFIDFLKASGQAYWQILPIGPTSLGDSPYQSPSTYAGNPYFIDFEKLIEEGLINEKDCKVYGWGDEESKVDYEIIYKNRFKVLKVAYKNRDKSQCEELEKFKEINKEWVLEYGFFMALKEYFGMKEYTTWPLDIRRREINTLIKYKETLKEEIEFNVYVQYLFYKQWSELKEYANKNNIKIIGDIPIYVSQDSVDTWANPELFQLDNDLLPIKVAGCPPDAFSEDGQLWGNPLYKWDYMKNNKYKWWIDRIQWATTMYDFVRIDHFRGFASYYSIKYGAKDARKGEWKSGPGYELFEIVREKIPSGKIIAEDLGYLTEDVYELINKVNYPGMKVLLFGFGGDGDSEFMPHNITENYVGYIGTHDNDTFIGWINNGPENEVELAKKYMNLTKEEGYNWGAIRTLYGTQAKIAIVQMQDFFGLDNEARMNLPSTVGCNWKWRMKVGDYNDILSNKILELSQMFGRVKS